MPARPLRFPTTARDEKVLVRLRKLCLALPEVTETGSFGHPNFRTGKKIFAAYEPVRSRPSIAFKLGAEQATLSLVSDKRFFPTPYGGGHWVSLWADEQLNWKEIEELLLRGYRGVALKRMLAALDGKA
jgi:predicted DNA-binding protein (MmcQ/YjbR family)